MIAPILLCALLTRIASLRYADRVVPEASAMRVPPADVSTPQPLPHVSAIGSTLDAFRGASW